MRHLRLLFIFGVLLQQKTSGKEGFTIFAFYANISKNVLHFFVKKVFTAGLCQARWGLVTHSFDM